MTADERRPRVLLVTRNMPPLVGGMERLNWHMAEELAKVAELRIVAPEGSAALAPGGIVVREAPLKPLWKYLASAAELAWRAARDWEPDFVLAGSGLVAPIAYIAARRAGAKSAVYVHGLDVAVRHPVYRAIWLPVIRRVDRVIANSHATARICSSIGVATERLGIVHPGVDLPIVLGQASQLQSSPPNAASRLADVPENEYLEPRHPTGQDFRREHRHGDRPLLLSVGRLSSRKGLREFVLHAFPVIVAAYPETLLLIVGDVPKDALYAQSQTPASIRQAAQSVGVERNLCFLGVISDYAKLGEIYRAANVHVFPVRQLPGDPEGFGMVAVEAAAHGLPTVAFASGGIVDAVAEGQSGRLVEPGNYAAFADAVVSLLANTASWRSGCTAFAERFAWPIFGRQVAEQLLELTTLDES